MADVASVLFNLLATNDTGPGIDGAIANMSKLDAAQAESATVAEESAAKQAAAAGEASAATAEGAAASAEHKSGGLGGLVELAGIAAVGEGIKSSVEAAETANKTFDATTAVLKSTGNAAGLTTDQIKSMSDSMGEANGVTGVVTEGALNLELRNSTLQQSMGKGVISAKQLTQTTLDLAASMAKGGSTSDSMSAAAAALTKAMGNPFAPTKALTAAGVTLTQQQTAQLKAFKSTNDVADAQKLVLEALGQATTGQAEANTTAGAKLSAQLDDLKVTIGEKLLPVVERMTQDFTNVINFIEEHSTIFGLLGSVIGAVAGAVLLVVGATKAWAAAQELLDVVMDASPIGLVIVAVAGLAAGIYYAYTHFETFRNGVNDVWHIVEDTFGWVKDHWPLLLGILTGPFGLMIALIVTHFHTLKSDVTGFFSDAFNWLEQAGEDVINGLVHGIENMAMAPVNAVKGIAGDVKSAFSSVLGIFSPSRVFAEHGMNIMHGLANGITDNSDLATDAIKDVATKISGTAAGALNMSGGVSVSNQHALQIEMDFTGAGTDAMVTALRRAVRLKGKGNVQAYLGAAS